MSSNSEVQNKALDVLSDSCLYSHSVKSLYFVDVPKYDGFLPFETVGKHVSSHEPGAAFL